MLFTTNSLSIFFLTINNFFLLQMSNKRARLDETGRQVRQLELELELARLRREDEDAREEAPSVAESAATVQDTTAPPTSQPGTATLTTTPTPAAVSTATPAPTTATAATPAGSEPARGRSRGGGMRGTRGRSFSLDNRGLQTVFVCVACDKIYCQHCNAYEQARSYWARQ